MITFMSSYKEVSSYCSHQHRPHSPKTPDYLTNPNVACAPSLNAELPPNRSLGRPLWR